VVSNSRLPGFFRLDPTDRLGVIAELVDFGAQEVAALKGEPGLELEQANRMIENVVGVYGLPLGIATNLRVNHRDVLVPLAIEEPSVVAGLSYAARLVREGGGFYAHAQEPIMIGQIQVVDVVDPHAARLRLLARKDELLERANQLDPVLVGLGGGARDLEVRVLDSPLGPMLGVHLLYDTRDAMGANAVNTAVEALAPDVERITGGRVVLRILSNLADRRLVRAWGRVPKEVLGRDDVQPDVAVQRILEAYAFALVDPYRAATHNKGIMNGIDAVLIATGNDWRAVEAGAHAYAARSGRYQPLTTWERTPSGDLVGTIELPIAAGIVGGATRVHPQAKAAIKLLGVSTARELAEILAAVGLAQNLAALRALALEGIQQGHMRLHARQVALAAGAKPDEVEQVAAEMVREGVVRVDRAEAILQRIRHHGKDL